MKKAYKLISLVLLAVIISNLLVLHSEIEKKLTCINDVKHFQLENISDSKLGKERGSDYLNDSKSSKYEHNCYNLPLDNQFGKEYAKIRKNIFHQYIQVFYLNIFENNKNLKSQNNFYDNRYRNEKQISELLKPIQILI